MLLQEDLNPEQALLYAIYELERDADALKITMKTATWQTVRKKWCRSSWTHWRTAMSDSFGHAVGRSSVPKGAQGGLSLPLANGAELSRAVNALAAGQDAETLRLILRSLSDLSQNREAGENIRRLFAIKKDELLPLFFPDAKVRKTWLSFLGRLDADLYSSSPSSPRCGRKTQTL